jgi:DNA-binding Xre family transcriptional regulator
MKGVEYMDESRIKEWFSIEVRERMEELNLRPYHMAYFCQFKQNSIYQYLNGTIIPDPWRLVLMAEVLECSVNDLLGFDNDDVRFEKYQASAMFLDDRQFAFCVSDRLERYLRRVDISLGRLSELTGITITTIKRWFGMRPSLLRTNQLLHICEALNCTPSELLGY